MANLRKARAQLISGENGENVEDVDILTSADAVSFSDGRKLTEVETTITQQLAQTATQPVRNLAYGDVNVAGKNISRTIVTFISDDGFIEDYTKLKPIFEAERVPFSPAIVSDWVGNSRCMSVSQIKEIENMGCEILGHTKTHPELGTLTEAQLEKELKESKSALKSMGFDVNHIVYPYGSYSNLVKKIARKYYRSGYLFGNTAQTNSQPYDTYAIKRIALGSYFDRPSSEFPVTNTFNDYYKPMVDKAVANKEWLIITLHPGASNGEFTAEQQGYLTQTIQYIKSLNIPIKNPTDVLNELGNLIDVVGYTETNQEIPFKIGANGKLVSTGITQSATIILNANERNAMSKESDFEPGYVTHVLVSSANASGTPNGKGGVLVTNRTIQAKMGLTGNLTTQTFYEISPSTGVSGKVYVRTASAGVDYPWGQWEVINENKSNRLTDNQLPSNTPPTGFPTGKTTSQTFNSSGNKSDLPNLSSGTLHTFRHETAAYNDFAYQVFYAVDGNIYTRRHSVGGAWGGWRKVVTASVDGYFDNLKNKGVVVNEQKTSAPSTSSISVANKSRIVLNTVTNNVINNLIDGVEGQEIILLNTSGQSITLKHLANANDGFINLEGATDYVLKEFKPIKLIKFTNSWYVF